MGWSGTKTSPLYERGYNHRAVWAPYKLERAANARRAFSLEMASPCYFICLLLSKENLLAKASFLIRGEHCCWRPISVWSPHSKLHELPRNHGHLRWNHTHDKREQGCLSASKPRAYSPITNLGVQVHLHLQFTTLLSQYRMGGGYIGFKLPEKQKKWSFSLPKSCLLCNTKWMNWI